MTTFSFARRCIERLVRIEENYYCRRESIAERLTCVECHLADYDPSRGEVQVQLEEFTASSVQTDRDVSGVLQHEIRYVGIWQRLVLVVGLAVCAEPDVCFRKYLPIRWESVLLRNTRERTYVFPEDPFVEDFVDTPFYSFLFCSAKTTSVRNSTKYFDNGTLKTGNGMYMYAIIGGLLRGRC